MALFSVENRFSYIYLTNIYIIPLYNSFLIILISLPLKLFIPYIDRFFKLLNNLFLVLIGQFTFPSKYSAPPASDPPPAAISLSKTSTHSLVDLFCDISFHLPIPPCKISAHLSQSGLKLHEI